jgi:mono/diheme cytochrome c family protein
LKAEAMMKRQLLRLLLVMMASLVVSAFPQIKSPPQPAIRPVDGASIFRNNCAACHGLDGRGKGPLSRILKRDVPDLTRLSQRNDGTFPAVHVRNTIVFGADDLLPAHGSKAMPIWGPIFHEIDSDQDLGNVRLDNITRYLQSIQRK